MNQDTIRIQRFVKTLDQNHAKLKAFIHKMVKNSADAEDILQDAATSVFEKIQKGQEIENLKAYLFQSAKNRCMRHFKQNQIERSRIVALQGLILKTTQFESRILDSLELQHLEEKAKAQFNLKEKEVFEKRYYRKMRLRQIAKEMNTSAATVSRMLHKMQKKLRKDSFTHD